MAKSGVDQIAAALVANGDELPATGSQFTWGRLVQLVEHQLSGNSTVLNLINGSAESPTGPQEVRLVRDALTAASAADPRFADQLTALWALLNPNGGRPVLSSGDAGRDVVQIGSMSVHEHLDEHLPVPRQLPLDVANFIGRAAEMSDLDGILLRPDGERSPTAVISAIAGAPGVGKTALALHWAHHAREAFTDGQLYVNLCGYGPDPPLEPGEVLTDFLRALDVTPSKIPRDLEPKAALYRSLMANRRMLVLLDNAASSEQVRPLLPGTASSMVAVTTRSKLSGLIAYNGARRIRLGVLSRDNSVRLLKRIIGAARAEQEPSAVAELADLCGHLPLALRIAGEQVAAYPHRAITALVEELTDEQHRLDVLDLEDDDPAVRTVFSWSYSKLKPADAVCFRLLGLHVGGEISVEAAAALIGETTSVARRRMNSLVDSHLLEQVTHDRYRFHDLIRCYAAERAEAEETHATRTNAVRDCLLWYLHTADQANRTLMPQRRRIHIDDPSPRTVPLLFADHDAALAWCEEHRAHFVAATRLASDYGLDSIAWQLPVVLWSFFKLRKQLDDWISTHQIGIECARRAGLSQGEAWALNSLGNAYRELQRNDEAIEVWQRALTIRQALGDRYGEGTSLNNLAGAFRRLGRYDEAIDYSRRALQIHREIGDSWNEGIDLSSLGNAHRAVGRLEEAIACWRQALEIQQEIGDQYGEGNSLNHLGETFGMLGRWDEAINALRRALDLRRRLGDRYGEAVTTSNLGKTVQELGLLESARDLYTRAVQIFEQMGDPKAEEARTALRSLEHRSLEQK